MLQQALDDDFEVNVTDPRFKALYESQHYSIDPTNPNFTKTKASQKYVVRRGAGAQRRCAHNTPTDKRGRGTASRPTSLIDAIAAAAHF